jgi:prepilin peptidase CpaA
MNAPLWVAVPLAALVVLAARADVRTRKIPNVVTGPALLLGLATHFAINGWTGFQSSFTGMLIAGAILLPGWLMKWMGAGDVKLMAAVGAWLAWPAAGIGVLASLAAGGVIALIYAIRHRVLLPAVFGVITLGAWSLSRHTRGMAPPPVTTGVRFPFALAVLVGAIFALWVRP